MAKFPLLRKPRNKDRRSREYLTTVEMENIIKAARSWSKSLNMDMIKTFLEEKRITNHRNIKD